MVDTEVLEKYKLGEGGDYTLIYKAEGKDDPFQDMSVQSSQELSNEIAINLTGEVTMAVTMDGDGMEKLLNSYGNGGNATTIVYSQRSAEGYDSVPEEVIESMAKEDGEEE